MTKLLSRYYYAAPIERFLASSSETILGELTDRSEFDIRSEQRDAWRAQLLVLRQALAQTPGTVVLEYSIPRMGGRIDALVLTPERIFVIEFKVGATTFESAYFDQVHDYALDLQYFHLPSHHISLVPVVVATAAKHRHRKQNDFLDRGQPAQPVWARPDDLAEVLREFRAHPEPTPIDADEWLCGSYNPTPTIVEAAVALYAGHSVDEIARHEAGDNLVHTTSTIDEIIETSRAQSRKSICFVTGVPGAGKTLVGLDIANKHTDRSAENYSVFLSGNGPLVKVVTEALARDAVSRARDRGERLTKKEATACVKQFVQNVHHFRDSCLRDPKPPIEHVALFDEAQRAWNLEQTAKFMRSKKGRLDFDMSEPEFLISCLDRHSDWATIVCLIGSGQEINTGEGGVSEWVRALDRFPGWRLYASPSLKSVDRSAYERIAANASMQVSYQESLHLRSSMRSFRSENMSELVRALLDLDSEAKRLRETCCERFPVVLTRDVNRAKRWVKERAKGSERYGVVVSSAAQRLRPFGVHVKAPIDEINWFLDGKDDVRSSYYLEDVATEFHIQGLEIDYTCLIWDADLRHGPTGWQQWSFKGSKWQRIKSPERRRYQINAYRVLLTRARQGMVIVVPEGSVDDPTRLPEYYDSTYRYLEGIGFEVL